MKVHSAFLLLLAYVVLTVPSVYGQSRYWVFFKNKPEAAGFSDFSLGGPAEQYLLSHDVLTQRAITRRLKVLPPSDVVSLLDFPVYSGYIDSLESIGLKVIGTSRWFNAASVVTDSLQIVGAMRFPFVRKTQKVATSSVPVRMIARPGAPDSRFFKVSSAAVAPDSSLYGPSWAQLELSGVPKLQALGINGQGVLLGMLDSGFRYETHDALKNIRIIGEHDFVQNDSITANQPGDSSYQDNHGTSTLSVLGGYSPGNIIGVSYGSSFMLAKTEYVPVTDFQWEEDNWVEGLEWMEAHGVDVVSSSVAYSTYVDSTGQVDSSISYFFSRGDFNGKTSYASRAAAIASRLGVIVVQAMGNEGNGNGTIGTMDVPADADSIISVGAVDQTGHLADFSSTGPTNDGRIKPDLVADGVDDYVATVPGPDTYDYESGTSFSTPITAGIASLILSVRPNYTPMQVIDLLKETAIEPHYPGNPMTSVYPNDFYGWGIVNAWNAVKKIGFVGSNSFVTWQEDSVVYVAAKAFSTSGINMRSSRAYYSYGGAPYKSVPVFSTDTSNQYAFVAPLPASASQSMNFYFDLIDSSGAHLNVPYYGASQPFNIGGFGTLPPATTRTFRMYVGYPNPFSLLVHVPFILFRGASVSIDVYDVLGRKVANLFNGELPSGYQEVDWDGTVSSGNRASSGVYFIRIIVDGIMKVEKVLYLK